MSFIAAFGKLCLWVYLGELQMDQPESQKPGITDQISESLTNSGQRSVERWPMLDFNFDFPQFREEGILRNGNAAGKIPCFDFQLDV